MGLGTLNDTITVTLTKRELTLIRVACLQRLERLQKQMEDAGDAERLKHLTASYDDTRAMMDTGGVLLKAACEARLVT